MGHFFSRLLLLAWCLSLVIKCKLRMYIDCENYSIKKKKAMKLSREQDAAKEKEKRRE